MNPELDSRFVRKLTHHVVVAGRDRAEIAHVAAYAEGRRGLGNLHLAHLLQKDVLEWVLAAPSGSAPPGNP